MKTIINWNAINQSYPNQKRISIDSVYMSGMGWLLCCNGHFSANRLLNLKDQRISKVSLMIETPFGEIYHADFSIDELLTQTS